MWRKDKLAASERGGIASPGTSLGTATHDGNKGPPAPSHLARTICHHPVLPAH